MGPRNPDSHGCARSASAGNCELASEQPSSLSHAQYPKRATCRKLFLANATAIILNFQGQIAVVCCQAHVYLRRVRVPRDIRQGLLKDAKQCRGALVVD